MEEIIMTDQETGEEIPFYIVEETTLNEKHYLLVSTDDPDEMTEESEAAILYEVSEDGEESVFATVEDEEELDAIAKVFAELLDDTDISVE